MVYTIGEKHHYDRYLAEATDAEPAMKGGKTAEREGGSVWLTKGQAQLHCPVGCKVYGVDADWERDTAPVRSGRWHQLLVDARLIDLDAVDVGAAG